MVKHFSFFFDARDYELRRFVNDFLERPKNKDDFEQQKLLRSALHPHGIKELAIAKEMRIAQAVIELLGSLEAGQVDDRIDALQTLHDEVMYTESSNFRHNTGRVLIQIMKSLIRAYGNPAKQLCLAHDFCSCASGKRRIIRAMLKRYSLLEMPEEWNQIAFDHHVHDANTKGRKTATHLIMDAWIKGIRKLNVIYYNYIDHVVVEELLKAADIMGVEVQIGIEFQVLFRDDYVQFVWEPSGFHTHQEFLEFLDDKSVNTIMEMGKRASFFHHEYVLKLLNRYNERLRHEIGESYGLELSAISEKEILGIVGRGQTSRTHLAELIYRRILNAFETEKMQAKSGKADEDNDVFLQQLTERIDALNPEEITESWLSLEKNPDIYLPRYSEEMQHVPEIMRYSAPTLIDWLVSVRTPCNIVLNLNSLTIEDVLELLYTCNGKISHLELFNLKNYTAGRLKNMPAISDLLTAINEGSAIVLKRLIRSILKDYDANKILENADRCSVFSEILQDIPKLQSFYSITPLKTRIGSDSTSRAKRQHGMGFVFPITLPHRARNAIKKNMVRHETIPLSQAVYPRTTWYQNRYHMFGSQIIKLLRKIPGMRLLSMQKKREWLPDPKTAQYNEQGNISLLGGFQSLQNYKDLNRRQTEPSKECVGTSYMNTTVKNVLKVVFGFTLTVLTFLYTQDWWFLVWFGPIIWFGITGFRNIIQATLGGGGLRRTPLLRWNDYLSWSRLCDSLMYTGLSVPLLEFFVRWLLLGKVFDLNPTNDALIFYSCISLVNGVYIAAHNIYRGLPNEAVIGNIFRSFIAIPVSLVYSNLFYEFVLFAGLGVVLVEQCAAVISKLASDTVAAVIEGFADKVDFLRVRRWDYSSKLKNLFDTFSQVEVIVPDHDILELVGKEGRLSSVFASAPVTKKAVADKLEKLIIIDSLDLLYFWMYLPRARSLFGELLSGMTKDETEIFACSQTVLLDVHKVSQLFVDGLVGENFAKPLSFYLAKYTEYLRDIEKITQVPILAKGSLDH